MPQLKDVLSKGPALEWIVGTVTAVYPDSRVSIAYRGGSLDYASVLDQYTPVVGDTVHALSHDRIGVLVIGSGNTPAIPDDPGPVEQPVIEIPAIAQATHGPVAGTWVDGVLYEEQDKVACFFYDPVALAAVDLVVLQLFQIEITLVAGGPPEFVPHKTPTPDGVLSLVNGPRYSSVYPPLGVPTWVDLPIEWGQALISGTISGIGIASDLYTGVYSGTGRLRFQPLAVTTAP